MNISIEELPTFEEKWLRNAIIFYLPRLRDLYDQYACVACLENLPYNPLLIRMFLWQLYRDCNLPEKGISLVQADEILANTKNSGVETKHNPFEKIYFSQFLHSLISIAWELYGEEVVVDGTDSILRKVFSEFLENDIFPNARHYKGTK